jgi:hypothetical protein
MGARDIEDMHADIAGGGAGLGRQRREDVERAVIFDRAPDRRNRP